MLFGMGAVMTFGFWKLGKGIREQKYVYPLPPGWGNEVGVFIGYSLILE